jgi:hypothetical protein
MTTFNKNKRKWKIAASLALIAIFVSFGMHLKHRYAPKFNFSTGEFSTQDQKTFEYWGLYWTDGRPYPYHNSQYYIEYYYDYSRGSNWWKSYAWRFNSAAIHAR